MRIDKLHNGGLQLELSAEETDNWATRPGASWPCSFLRGRRVFAEFATNGDLIDLAIDGGRGEQDCPSNEFNAICTDHIATHFPSHPALRGKAQPV